MNKVKRMLWYTVLVVIGSSMTAACIALFTALLHQQPGPDCILLRYLVSPNASDPRPYYYVLTCPEGWVQGWSWEEVAANYRKAVPPFDHERVWRP